MCRAMKVFNRLRIFILAVFSICMSGCDLLYLDSKGWEEYPVQHKVYEEWQSDIHYQKIEVFNDTGSFSEFLLSIPSVNIAVLTFDEKQETMIALTVYSNPCVFDPYVSGVTMHPNHDGSSETTMHVRTRNVENQAGDSCDTDINSDYRILFVSIPKTEESISVDIRYEF